MVFTLSSNQWAASWFGGSWETVTERETGRSVTGDPFQGSPISKTLNQSKAEENVFESNLPIKIKRKANQIKSEGESKGCGTVEGLQDLPQFHALLAGGNLPQQRRV